MYEHGKIQIYALFLQSFKFNEKVSTLYTVRTNCSHSTVIIDAPKTKRNFFSLFE